MSPWRINGNPSLLVLASTLPPIWAPKDQSCFDDWLRIGKKWHHSDTRSSSSSPLLTDCEETVDPQIKGLPSSSISNISTTTAAHTESDHFEQQPTFMDKYTASGICLAVKAHAYPVASEKPQSTGLIHLMSNTDPGGGDTKENVQVTSHKAGQKEKRKKQTRKPLQPQRSPSKIDPQFCGVTFQMKPRLLGDVTQLSISASFKYKHY